MAGAAMAPAAMSRALTAGLKAAVNRVPTAGAVVAKDVLTVVVRPGVMVAVAVAAVVAAANAAVPASVSGWTPRARCRRLKAP